MTRKWTFPKFEPVPKREGDRIITSTGSVIEPKRVAA